MPVADEARASIMAWRRAQRTRLIEARLQSSVAERQAASRRIAALLDNYCRDRGLLSQGTIISGYWPLRGEPDLRPWLTARHQAGSICVLPMVAGKGEPLIFRRWFPGCAMEKGPWNIPVPAAPEQFTPELLLAPVVGFDTRCYRLGYGGGYFDRTLALLQQRGTGFHVIGVGYEAARLDSVQPLAHDIALHAIVTENVVTACE